MSPYVIWKIGHKSRKNGNNISANIIKWYLRIVYHQDISLLANIGEGASFAHGGIGTVVTGKATIGRNCSIGNNVVIGQIVTSGLEGPRIGDNVFIGAGAKVLGAVNIGNNVSIGANALVLKDVEDDVTVGGVPAKPLQKKIFSVEFNKSEKFEGSVSRELRELFLSQGYRISKNAKFVAYDDSYHKKNYGKSHKKTYRFTSENNIYKLKTYGNILEAYLVF